MIHKLSAGNWSARRGVYSVMWRGPVYLLCVWTALAQAPQPDPIHTLLQATWKARGEGRFEDAAAKREQARSLLERMPADDPRYPGWVQPVAQLYANAAMTARARSIVQNALDRTAALGESHANRIALLGMMADFWQQDRNLVKAVAYLEKEAAALEARPAASTSAVSAQPALLDGVSVSGRNVMRFGVTLEPNQIYQRLADLYRQLGRPDDVNAMIAKVRATAKPGDNLAWFFENHGLSDEAVSLVRERVQRASNPHQESSEWQSLAGLYERQQRYEEAIAAFRRAESSLQADGAPPMQSPLFGLRQRLANVLQQAGRRAEADKVYQQMLSNTQDADQTRIMSAYASHLSSTNRAAEAEELLKQYQANHPNLQPWQEESLAYALAEAARSAGAGDRAEEYMRPIQVKQRSQPPGTAGNELAIEFQKAQRAANAGNLDEAFTLAGRAMDTASRSANREQVAQLVSYLAASLASRKEWAKAEMLYQRLDSLVESWSGDTVQPLIQAAQSYAAFLRNYPERKAAVPGAMARYRNLAIAAHGAESGAAAEAIGMALDFERGRRPATVIPAAAELLALEESLSGPTGASYLAAVRRVADVYESNGDPVQAVDLRRTAVRIADRACAASDVERGAVRMQAALTLARQGQFDEAERLAVEAVAIGQTAKPRAEDFRGRLEQVRRMRSGTNAGSTPVAADHWFERRLY